MNDDDYMKNLIMELENKGDSLEELRKMIKKTKTDIKNYAGDLYSLKTNVCIANYHFKEIGRGVDDGILWDIDYLFQENMPGGDKTKIFE